MKVLHFSAFTSEISQVLVESYTIPGREQYRKEYQQALQYETDGFCHFGITNPCKAMTRLTERITSIEELSRLSLHASPARENEAITKVHVYNDEVLRALQLSIFWEKTPVSFLFLNHLFDPENDESSNLPSSVNSIRDSKV